MPADVKVQVDHLGEKLGGFRGYASVRKTAGMEGAGEELM
jgi:hypothetical protein